MHPHSPLAVAASATREPGVVVPAEPEGRRRRKWLLLLLLLLSAVPSVVTTSISFSMFADQALAPSDAFAAPEVDVAADPPVFLIAGGMLPGDAVTGSIRIENRGSQPIRYAVTSMSSQREGPLLAGALMAEVRAEGSGCAAFDGPVLYRGPLADARIGDAAPGGHSGDRRLAGGSGEVLCLAITLPRPAGDDYQDTSATAVFTVSAEEDR